MPSSDRKSRRLAPWVPLAAGAAILIAIAGYAITASGGEADQPDAPPSAPVSADIRDMGEQLARRDADDPMAMGETDAPVVLIAYSDYNCPFCGRWVRDIQPELMPYVEDGDLRIEWREFPYLGDASTTAARAAHAAGRQGRFWEFHDAYYAEDEKLEGDALQDELDAIAEAIGLDGKRFDDDRESGEAAQAVQRDFDEGVGIGVNGTPAFLINGQPVMGAQPLPVFTQAVDAALDDAEGAA
ncbi:protein-disulfide isomerase [Nocardiopsis mwathae]|uniref:Protein-disulfide isomerase n=1 Tax=Nocardiopsis mwathae TaxID=1472723 RepID=A0A7W9YJR7_9ACTN|nr:DsbA family protein [Nocardiopsis mwathae]MBB6173332.1 protein-disulfide isomerase [Nocardiopsis mwathae]